jgi:hypothetical protein
MLEKHKKLVSLIKKTDYSTDSNIVQSLKRFFIGLVGFPFASIGWTLNVIPYQLCNLMVKHFTKYEVATTATYKVVYSLLFYPVTYLIEGVLLYMYFGWMLLIPFMILIIPLSYFTLYYMEWFYWGKWEVPFPFPRLRKTIKSEMIHRLDEQNRQIKDLVDKLAARFDQQFDSIIKGKIETDE